MQIVTTDLITELRTPFRPDYCTGQYMRVEGLGGDSKPEVYKAISDPAFDPHSNVWVTQFKKHKRNWLMRHHRIFLHIAAIFLLASLFLAILHTWASTPIVQFSWSTKQCVQVIGGAQGETCEQLPRRFEKEWVK